MRCVRPKAAHSVRHRCSQAPSLRICSLGSRVSQARLIKSTTVVQAVTHHIQVQEFEGKQYVHLGEVEQLMQTARTEAEISLLGTQEQLRAQGEQAIREAASLKKELSRKLVLLEHTQHQLEEAQAQVGLLTKELERAVLTAAEQLEGRFKLAYEESHRAELATLQSRLDVAMRAATEMESRALSAAVRAEESLLRHGEEAAAAVQTETQAALQMAKVSTEKAHAAAQQSAAAAQHALQQQQESLELVTTIQRKALEAEQRANTAHNEALALQAEVTQLRERLKDALRSSGEAQEKAAAADKAAAERMAQLEEESRQRLAAMEQAYEALKKVERDRVVAGQREVEQLTRRNQELAAGAKAMQEAAATMQSEVTQARAQAEAAAATLADKQRTLQANVEAQMDTGLKNLDVLKKAFVAEARQQVLGEVEAAVAEAKALMARMQSEMESQMLAQRRALEATTQERNFWRQRCLSAEEEFRALQVEAERAQRSPSSNGNGNGFTASPELPPTRRVIGRQQLWRLLAEGPRVDRALFMEPNSLNGHDSPDKN